MNVAGNRIADVVAVDKRVWVLLTLQEYLPIEPGVVFSQRDSMVVDVVPAVSPPPARITVALVDLVGIMVGVRTLDRLIAVSPRREWEFPLTTHPLLALEQFRWIRVGVCKREIDFLPAVGWITVATVGPTVAAQAHPTDASARRRSAAEALGRHG